MKLKVLILFVSYVTATKLEQYNIDPKQISVSGLSAGAFMAAQMQVAYSRLFMGMGMIAGGPYMCAEYNLAKALSTCMKLPELMNLEVLEGSTRVLAHTGLIDPVENLSRIRAYFYGGTKDTIVVPGVVKKAESFFKNFISNLTNVKAVYSVKSEHGFPTMKLGGECDKLNELFINNCSYEASWEILNHIYGGIKKSVNSSKGGSLLSFDQTEFFNPLVYNGLDDNGYIYVPKNCKYSKIACRLHISLHGCLQGKEEVDTRFAEMTGYNDAGAANDVIILYPQVKTNWLLNPKGCFDWWGYTGINYGNKYGPQMMAIRKMVQRLANV